MASENTLAIRKIGRVKVTRIVRPGPGSGPKAPPTRSVTGYVLPSRRCGVVGTRTVPFAEHQMLQRKREQRAAVRESKGLKPSRKQQRMLNPFPHNMGETVSVPLA